MATSIGANVRTLPTVKPSTYAGRVGVVATRYEDEIGVLVNGRVVWFLEREIEEWNGSSSSVSVGKSAKSVRGQDGESPLSQSIPRDARTAECTGQGGAGKSTPRREMSTSTREALPAPAATTDRSLGTQERAREGQEAGERVPRPPREESGGPQEALAIDSRGVAGQGRRSVPEDDSGPSSPSPSLLGLKPGERGPGGGVVAACEGCRELWERPKARGRPSLNCPRCR